MPTGDYSIAAIQTTGIENINFNAYDTRTTDETILDMALMTGVQKIGVLSGSAAGDLRVDNAKAIVDVSLANAAGDFNLNYPAAVTSVLLGDQTQNLALSNSSSTSTVTLLGVEIVNVSSSVLASSLADLVIDSAHTLNITGDKNLTITAVVDMADTASTTTGAIDATIDASTFTGKLSIAPGVSAGDNYKITGGSADDKFIMGAGLNAYDVIDGGDGIDTISVDAGFASTAFTQVTNVEVTSVNAATTAISVNASKTAGSTVVLNLSDPTDGSTKLASTVTSADGKTISLLKTASDAADTANDDGVTLTITNAVDTSDDTVSLVMTGTGLATGADGGYDTVDVATYETVNITANKTAAVSTNEIITLSLGTPTSSVTIDGTGSFTTALSGSSKVTNFDASALAGALTLTANSEKATYKMGGASSAITFAANLSSADTVIGGAGTTDTVTATVGGMSAALGTSLVNISDVERIYLTTNAANAIDMSNVTGKHTLGVTDNKQTITGFDLASTISLGLVGDAAATASEIDVTAADATGADDTLTVIVDNTVGVTDSIIDASSIENLALTVQAATNGITLNMATGEFNAITIGQKTGIAPGAIDLGALHKNTTSLTSTSAGGVTASFAAQVAPNGSAATFSGKGTGIQAITGGAYADNFTISTTGAITHAITGGTGTDTTNITVSAAFVDPSTIDTENVNMSVANGASVTVAAATPFHAGVDAIVLTGGNSLSTFTTDVLNTALKSFDAAGFAGNVVVTVAADALDTTVTLTGSALTTDTVANTIATTGTAYALKSTGIERAILDVNADATVSLALTDAAEVDVDLAAAAKTVTLTSAEGTLIRVTKSATDSNTVVSLADSTGAADTLAFELDEGASASALVDGMNITVADVETVSIKVDDDVSVDLSGLTMTTAGKTMGLTLTGVNTLGISALGTDVTVVNASGKLAGGVVQTARSTTGTVEYTGGAGADTFIMTNLGDTMVGGAGSDTLDLNYSAILGGINVNLASTTNQIASANGGAITGSVTGFENVDLSGYTGSYGALITSGSSVVTGTTSTLIGTANADQINGGSGADTITGGGGVDVITTGGGADTVIFSAVSAATADTIADFASAVDKIELSIAVFDNAAGSLTAIGAGNSIAASFTSFANAAALTGGTVALSTNAEAIVHLQDTGAIYHNSDGATTGGLVLIGTVGSTLVDADFVLVV